jgi:hypothetical protein
MLDADDVEACEVEGIATYCAAGLDPERAAPIATVCRGLGWQAPRAERSLPREALSGVLHGEVVIRYRAGISAPRARFICAHEAAHRRRRDHHGSHALVEARADLLGACLLVPRPAFERAVGRFGHSIYDLAHALGITQAAALLRLGEVMGRPVKLLGRTPRERGAEFGWAGIDTTRALRGELRKIVHPIKLRDEGKWGLMSA